MFGATSLPDLFPAADISTFSACSHSLRVRKPPLVTNRRSAPRSTENWYDQPEPRLRTVPFTRPSRWSRMCRNAPRTGEHPRSRINETLIAVPMRARDEVTDEAMTLIAMVERIDHDPHVAAHLIARLIARQLPPAGRNLLLCIPMQLAEAEVEESGSIIAARLVGRRLTSD